MSNKKTYVKFSGLSYRTQKIYNSYDIHKLFLSHVFGHVNYIYYDGPIVVILCFSNDTLIFFYCLSVIQLDHI